MNKNLILRIQKSQAFAGIASLLAGITYFVQAWIYTHTQTSLVNVGGYLYTGYHMILGDLRSLQHYGPIQFQYPPFAYLIPGLVQGWFSPSPRTGRYFSLFLGIMMLIALWLTTRKLGGKWWGTAAWNNLAGRCLPAPSGKNFCKSSSQNKPDCHEKT